VNYVTLISIILISYRCNSKLLLGIGHVYVTSLGFNISLLNLYYFDVPRFVVGVTVLGHAGLEY
jgi:hypothetical protein